MFHLTAFVERLFPRNVKKMLCFTNWVVLIRNMQKNPISTHHDPRFRFFRFFFLNRLILTLHLYTFTGACNSDIVFSKFSPSPASTAISESVSQGIISPCHEQRWWLHLRIKTMWCCVYRILYLYVCRVISVRVFDNKDFDWSSTSDRYRTKRKNCS